MVCFHSKCSCSRGKGVGVYLVILNYLPISASSDLIVEV